MVTMATEQAEAVELAVLEIFLLRQVVKVKAVLEYSYWVEASLAVVAVEHIADRSTLPCQVVLEVVDMEELKILKLIVQLLTDLVEEEVATLLMAMVEVVLMDWL
jgi:hypothetical protein